MSVRTVHALSLVAALVAVALVATRRDTPPPAPPRVRHPLALVPPGPAFVATLDVAAVRKTEAAVLLEHAELGRLLGTGKGCALDPIRDLDMVVVTAASETLEPAPGPAPVGTTSVALIASGRLEKRTLVACAIARVVSRGGEPATNESGSFTVVRDRRAAGQFAARDGLFVLSEGTYLSAILAAAEGRGAQAGEAERARDRLHVELRRTFGRGAPLMASLIVPGGFLERTFGEEAARSALAGVRSAALRAEVRDKLVLGAFLGCANEAACRDVDAFLGETKSAVAPLVGGDLGRILESIATRRERERVELLLELSLEDLKAVGAELGLGG